MQTMRFVLFQLAYFLLFFFPGKYLITPNLHHVNTDYEDLGETHWWKPTF